MQQLHRCSDRAPGYTKAMAAILQHTSSTPERRSACSTSDGGQLPEAESAGITGQLRETRFKSVEVGGPHAGRGGGDGEDDGVAGLGARRDDAVRGQALDVGGQAAWHEDHLLHTTPTAVTPSRHAHG